ncbi:NADP-specific glutamate dehydrogenase [Vagococcus salmoninarum]|uniref:NADP-specific glutamate dehydrogenase n=1 Tax=Vagococcus salmoninarum TaxID=2739 RepID=UPI0028D30956|nr:NADP-specific glutamate dehydrogenase [Vagococcus salmoninarum]
MTVSNYLLNLTEKIEQKNPGQEEYLQAIHEFLPTIATFLTKNPQIMESNVLELMLEPERLIQFRIPWQDDQGKWQVNRGFRVQYNSAIGPYKGGMRFHPTVTESVMKFLAFEQIFKNSLTGLPIGGGKGGSDFDPKGKSDPEIMRFCQSLMTELQKYIGPSMDVPAGDIGVGAREIGYLFGQYKRLNGHQGGVLTGKPLAYWGSLGRTEATGYGLVYFVKYLLADQKDTLEAKKIIVSGSGNVAIYAIQKAQELGGKVISCSDSSGYLIDTEGIDVALLKEVKEVNRERLSAYANERDSATYFPGKSVWSYREAYDIALPCATQNEIDAELAKVLVAAGVKIVAEGANMPSTLAAVEIFKEAGINYCPGKAANAGGVAVSALEMSQNSQRLAWTKDEVDQQLDQIMEKIYTTCRDTATEYATSGDLLAGANIAGFAKVATAMISQGLV